MSLETWRRRMISRKLLYRLCLPDPFPLVYLKIMQGREILYVLGPMAYHYCFQKGIQRIEETTRTKKSLVLEGPIEIQVKVVSLLSVRVL